MKLKAVILIFLLAFILPVFSGTVLLEFTYGTEDQQVFLNWRTGEETNLSSFEVQRSNDGVDFFTVGSVAATGSYSSYQFIDDELYKQSDRTFYYRLKMVDRDGHFNYSANLRVDITINPIRQTWGSIKAMFR